MSSSQNLRKDTTRGSYTRNELRSLPDASQPRGYGRYKSNMMTDEYSHQRRMDQGQFLPQEQFVSTHSSNFQVQCEDPLAWGGNSPVTMAHQVSENRSHKRLAKTTRQEPLFRKIEAPSTKNIVIFGQTGTGKSSLINMLSDDDVATVSNSALGCTFESTRHAVTIEGAQYTLWDSAGLNEGEAGSVPAAAALNHLRDLVENLKDGISLLVYCIRGSRYRDIIKVNYDLFTKIICQEEVPVVIVVTGLENEAHMENWWIENEKEFTMREMSFVDHACVTTSKGKKNMFEEEYEESKEVVKNLIQKCCPNSAWAVDSQLWFDSITGRIRDYYDEYNGYSRPETLMGDSVGDENPKGVFALLSEVAGHLANAASVMCEIVSPWPRTRGSSAGGLRGLRRDSREE